MVGIDRLRDPSGRALSTNEVRPGEAHPVLVNDHVYAYLTQTTAQLSDETGPSESAQMPPAGGSTPPDVNDPCGNTQPPADPATVTVDRFHHRDHLGTLRVVTDEFGWVLDRMDFMPYGMEIVPEAHAAGWASVWR